MVAKRKHKRDTKTYVYQLAFLRLIVMWSIVISDHSDSAMETSWSQNNSCKHGTMLHAVSAASNITSVT